MTETTSIPINALTESIWAPPERRWLLPDEPASVKGWIKHVFCEGSRDHVPWWEGRTDRLGRTVSVIRCSNKRCIVNLEADQRVASLEARR